MDESFAMQVCRQVCHLTALMNSAASVALGMPLCAKKPGCCRRVLYTSKTCARFGTLSATQSNKASSAHFARRVEGEQTPPLNGATNCGAELWQAKGSSAMMQLNKSATCKCSILQDKLYDIFLLSACTVRLSQKATMLSAFGTRPPQDGSSQELHHNASHANCARTIHCGIVNMRIERAHVGRQCW